MQGSNHNYRTREARILGCMQIACGIIIAIGQSVTVPLYVEYDQFDLEAEFWSPAMVCIQGWIIQQVMQACATGPLQKWTPNHKKLYFYKNHALGLFAKRYFQMCHTYILFHYQYNIKEMHNC